MAQHVLDLPVVSEEEDNICLPLVITVVARYWHEHIPIEEAVQIAKMFPNVKGSIMMAGIELAEMHGLKSYVYHGSLKDLQKRIDQGFPPIVILPGIQETIQHATVISGYDDSVNRVLTYFPQPDKIGAITYKQFNELWKEDDNVSMLIVPDDMSKIVAKDALLFAESNRLCFLAEKLHMQGKYDEAMATLMKAREIEPENARLWTQMGVFYNELSKDQAVECYQQAARLNPRSYLAYRGLGNYHLKKKDYENAEKYYSKTITINQFRFGPIYKNRAITRMELNRKEDAADDFEKYLDQCPAAKDRRDVEEMIKQLRS